jgi:hypothetical protein
MGFQYPEYREGVQQLCALQNALDNWTPWRVVMVLDQNHHGYINRNEGHAGSYKLGANPCPDACGIYEWKMTNHEREVVVYVGRSCNDGNSLRGRIIQYCQNVSHKSDLINHALNNQYNLEVRYRVFPGVAECTVAEDLLLRRYNYAWNVRANGIRAPLIELEQIV